MSTSSKNVFSVHDFITDFEDIYQIFGKKSEKDYHGVDCEYFLYHSIKDNQKAASFSIPVNNILKSGLRRLIEIPEIEEIYQILKKPLNNTDIFDFKTIKETLYLNDPIKTAFVLKQLCANKVVTAEKFSKNYQEILNEIVLHLSNEIAFVTKKTPESVEKKIRSLL
ncbi:MAG: hypothetical protein WC784_00545 [Candidatus Shapirobacteria bacterium]|jgi:RNA polymerase-interacting CarD/CdnL/TRCF family regulator